jgi:hypothetical protein
MELLYSNSNKIKKINYYGIKEKHLGMAENRLKQVTVPDESLVCPIQQGFLQTGVAVSR